MTRNKNGKSRKTKYRKLIKLSKTYKGSQSKLFKISNQRTMRALKNAYSARRKKKSDYKKLWINRINIFCRNNSLNYSKTKNILSHEKIKINSKIIAKLCIIDPEITKKLIKI